MKTGDAIIHLLNIELSYNLSNEDKEALKMARDALTPKELKPTANVVERQKGKTEPRYVDANILIDLATHEGAYGYVDVHDIHRLEIH